MSEERDAAHAASRSKAYRMILVTCLVMFGAMAAFALTAQMDWFGFRPRVLILLVLGMVLSVGLGSVLMAVSFHSNRSGIDEESGVLPADAGFGDAGVRDEDD